MRPNKRDRYWRSPAGNEEHDVAIAQHFDKYFRGWQVSVNPKWSRTGSLNFVDVLELRDFKGSVPYAIMTFGLSGFMFYNGGGSKYDAARQEILWTASSGDQRDFMIEVLETLVDRMFSSRSCLNVFSPLPLDSIDCDFVAAAAVTGLVLEECEGYLDMYYPTSILEVMLMKESDIEAFSRLGIACFEALPVYL
jgi:hypothetical protein